MLLQCPDHIPPPPVSSDDSPVPNPPLYPIKNRTQEPPSSRLKDIYLLFNSPHNIPSSEVSSNEPSRTPEQAAIIHHLETSTIAHINAINTRNFDRTTPAWSNMSSHFLSDVRSVCMKNPRRLNREDYIAQYRWLTGISPEYQLEVKDVSTELKVLSRGVTKGEVTLTMENTGNPPGVVRMIVGIVEWRREGVEGVWECVEVRAARGVDEFEARNEE